MKKIMIFIIFIPLLLVACKTKDGLNLPIDIKEEVLDFQIGKISKDEKDYLVVLTKGSEEGYGKDIIIYDLENNEEVYRKDYIDLKPWKITIGDVDGDKIDDISIGVYKKSPLHDIMAKRPFIYAFENGQIIPKWRGSRLSRPFEDYILYDIDGDNIEEIIAIEILDDNTNLINSYKWKGFGFEGHLESKAYNNIENIFIEDNILYVDGFDEVEKFTAKVMHNDKNLILERVELNDRKK